MVLITFNLRYCQGQILDWRFGARGGERERERERGGGVDFFYSFLFILTDGSSTTPCTYSDDSIFVSLDVLLNKGSQRMLSQYSVTG